VNDILEANNYVKMFLFLAHSCARMQAMNEYRGGPNVDGSLWAEVCGQKFVDGSLWTKFVDGSESVLTTPPHFGLIEPK